MKIAVSSTGEGINSKVSEVFGRCPYFVIAEIENQKIKKTETIENKNIDQISGAGISTAQLMAEKNIKAVITKNIGPRASDILKQFNIAIYYGTGTIKGALQKLIDNKLEKIS